MFDTNPSPSPTNGGPLPPWQQRPRPNSAAPQAPAQPEAPKSPGFSFVTPPTPPSAVRPATEQKDWGPIKPIRPVPKPSEEKMSYVLAQAERVVDPENENSKKRWVIIGSITGIIVVIGGTLAFIFFGRNESPTIPANQAVILVNTNKSKNTNAIANSVFQNPNTNVAGNSNTAVTDTDGDGLSDVDEAKYGTSIASPDTDGDGYTDGQEVRGGYNPLGSGKLN